MLRVVVILVLLVLCAPAAPAADGRATMDQLRGLEHGERAWDDRRQALSLRIEDPRGGVRERALVMLTRRTTPGEDRTLTVFRSPAELRGTAFLQFAHADSDAEQWLYLPELERVRRITSRARKQSFMGTDFSYRDLELLTDVIEWKEEDASARSLGMVPWEDGEAERIELLPSVKDVGYTRIVVTISRPEVLLRRMEFFEGGKSPVKTLDLGDIREVQGIPTPGRLTMVRHARGGRTVIEVSEVRYDSGLPARTFTQRSLERGLDAIE